MVNENQKATLKDIINYEPDLYITKEEIELIRYTFRSNKKLLNLIRKIMLPTMSDPSMPIEEMGNDVYLTGVDWMTMPAEHCKTIIQGRQEAIKFVAGGLIKLQMIANTPDESAQDKKARLEKDSTK